MKRALISVSLAASVFVLVSLLFAPRVVAQSKPRARAQTPAATASKQTAADAGGEAKVEEVAKKFYLISIPSANLLLYVGADTSFVAGVQHPALVKQALATLEKLKAPPVKYALVDDDEHAGEYLDGGWKSRGAVSITQERLNNRLAQAARSAASGAGAGGFAAIVAKMPAMSFSEVIQLWISDEETHIIHQRAGYSDADTIIHFERSGVLYLGHTLTTDGYPRIDTGRGGNLAGMIETTEFFVNNFGQVPDKVEPIIPGRGPVATLKELADYRDMLKTVRDRVSALKKQGKSAQEIVAAKPTAEYDAKWGHGPVTAAEFVSMVFASVQ